jgi:hypothetical protein
MISAAPNSRTWSQRLGRRAPQRSAYVRREGRLDRGVPDAEILRRGRETIAQIVHQLADGGDRRLLADRR